MPVLELAPSTRQWPKKAALLEAVLNEHVKSGLSLSEFSRQHLISQPTLIVGRQALMRGEDVPAIGGKVLGRIARDFPHLRRHVLAALIELADDFGSPNQHTYRSPSPLTPDLADAFATPESSGQ